MVAMLPQFKTSKGLHFLAGLFGWLVVVSTLLLLSYKAEKKEAFEYLALESNTTFSQIKHHWPDVQPSSQQEKNAYLISLSSQLKPKLHVSVISTQGKVIASSLHNLTQLSYGPVVNRIQSILHSSRRCTKYLTHLQIEPVNACGYKLNDSSLFVVTLHFDDVFSYWLVNQVFFLILSLISLCVIFIVLYLNHKYKNNALDNYKQLEFDIKKQNNDFKRLIGNFPGVLYRLKLSDHSLNYLSPGSYELLGHPPEYFFKHNLTPFDLIDEEDQSTFKQERKAAHFSLKPFEMVYRISTPTNEHKWVLDRGRSYESEKNAFYIEGVMLDITERELVRQQIEFLAIQDPLTELYNRFRFNDELVQAVSHAKMTDEHFAMLFIDLDRFKNINDSLGHQLGDRLLQHVAQRLLDSLPAQHFLARMGGDEFVILMRDINTTQEVEKLAKSINGRLRQVFKIDSNELHTSCSIGISVCPEHSEHSHILWRYADTAMYQVKNRGGDGYQFFTQEMGDMVQHRINIEHSFIPSFESQQFELFYQPQVDIHTNQLLGCEALIRWHHPEMGSISPVEFIPIAEETGFIHVLGEWILEQSIKQLKEWRAVQPNFIMCINISAAQITPDLPNRLYKLIQTHGIRCDSIELEITESLLMENIDLILPILNEIKDLGISFAIDDFGTGYSSLSYLRYLPINKLKIDRAFIKNIEKNQDDVAMVKAIVAMAKNLNLITLAEGIETPSQRELVQSLACERYQGYLFSKPLDANSFSKLYMQ